MFPKIRQGVEFTATVAVAIAASVILWKTVYPDKTVEPPPQTPARWQVGDLVDIAKGIDFSTSPSTLLMFIQSSCKYCTESMELYRTLAKQPRTTRLIAVGSEPADSLVEYLRRHDVVVDEVKSVSTTDWRVTGTPTLLLVGRDQKVRGVWIGKVDEKRSSAVVDAVLAR